MGVNNIFWHPPPPHSPPATHTEWLLIQKGCWAVSQSMGKTVSIGTSHRLAMLLSACHVFLPPFNCFPFFFLLSNVVFVSTVQWRKSAMCIHISPPSWGSPFLPPLSVTTEHGAEFSVMGSSFQLAVLQMVVCMCRGYSPSSPSPTLPCPHMHSLSLPLSPSWKWVHLYQLSRVHISALIDSKHFMTSVQNSWEGESWISSQDGEAPVCPLCQISQLLCSKLVNRKSEHCRE